MFWPICGPEALEKTYFTIEHDEINCVDSHFYLVRCWGVVREKHVLSLNITSRLITLFFLFTNTLHQSPSGAVLFGKNTSDCIEYIAPNFLELLD